MGRSRDPFVVRVSEALYAVVVAAYPRGFRSRFGSGMKATFRDAARAAQGRSGVAGLLVLWWRVLVDAAVTIPRERAAGVRRPRGRGLVSAMAGDVRQAVRSLVARPGFTAIAVLTLGLGIGANTALFSVVRSALLAPLPYRDPGQVAMIWSRWPGFEKTWVSAPEFVNYRATLHGFESLALYITGEQSITDGDDPERVPVAGFMPEVFDVLGVQPILGRAFRPEEAEGQPANVVILGYDLWQRRYGGDPSVIGRTLDLGGDPQTVIGVMPAGFRVPPDFRTDRPAQLWVPYALPEVSGPVPQSGGSHSMYAIGRLRPGVTEADANAELRSLTDQLNADGVYPADWHFRAFAVTAANEVSGTLRPALLVLLGAVALVLLIACANVANLLLVRGEERRREIGVRSALGAGAGRLVRQLLVENTVLALAGGAFGVTLAAAGIAALRALAPAGLPRVTDARIDGGMLAFTAGLSVLTALLFGLWPALRAARADVQSVLTEGGRANSSGLGRSRARRLIVTGEVAVAVMLAAGAGLMLRSFGNLLAIDPGFDAHDVLTMRLSTPSAFYPDDPSVTRFWSELLARTRALPGVEQAGLIRVLPIDQEIGDSCVRVEGYTPPPGECAPVDWQAASDGYFEALGIPLLEGRTIEVGDVADAAQAIVVNEAFVRKYFADGLAVGKHVTFAFRNGVEPQTVVGVVGDAHHNGLIGPVKPAFFRPLSQWSVSTGFPQRSMSLVVRTSRDPRALIRPVRDVIRELDPRLPVSSVQPMRDVLARAVAQPRFTMALLLAFGALALALAVTGIFGVVSYAVTARTRELGIRVALGAAPRSVLWLSIRQGLSHAIVGVVAGAAVGLFVTRFMRQLVFGIATTDPFTFVAVSALGLAVVTLACWLPARRAARTDPLTTLRAD